MSVKDFGVLTPTFTSVASISAASEGVSDIDVRVAGVDEWKTDASLPDTQPRLDAPLIDVSKLKEETLGRVLYLAN